MPEMSPNLAEIEGRIAVLRENIRELVEQAAAFSGAANCRRVVVRFRGKSGHQDLMS